MWFQNWISNSSNGFDNLNLRYNRPRASVSAKSSYSSDPNILISYFQNIYCSRYVWGGEFFNGIRYNYVENGIFYNGFMVAYLHPVYGFMILPASASRLNYMYQPIEYNLRGNGFYSTVDADDCVIIQDSPSCIPPYVSAYNIALELADLNATIATYMIGIKRPLILGVKENTKTSAEVIFNQLLDDNPVLFVDLKKLNNPADENPPLFHNMPHTPTELISLLQARKTLLSQAVSMLGIESNILDKSAYVSSDEQDKNQGFSNIIKDSGLYCRRKAVDEIKDKYGIDLEVKLIDEVYNEVQTNVNRSGDKSTNIE